jgi:hypothetical protein
MGFPSGVSFLKVKEKLSRWTPLALSTTSVIETVMIGASLILLLEQDERKNERIVMEARKSQVCFTQGYDYGI